MKRNPTIGEKLFVCGCFAAVLTTLYALFLTPFALFPGDPAEDKYAYWFGQEMTRDMLLIVAAAVVSIVGAFWKKHGHWAMLAAFLLLVVYIIPRPYEWPLVIVEMVLFFLAFLGGIVKRWK